MALTQEIEVFNNGLQTEGWHMEVSTEADTPVLKNGLTYLESKGDLLLALCLNNGYYSRENIYRILKFALAFSNRAQVFSTEGPAKHNYRAFGTPEQHIVRDTRLKRNCLHNHCIAGLKRINAELPADAQKSMAFLEWEEIYADSAYKESYAHLKQLYSSGGVFREDVDTTSRRVLSTRLGITQNIDAVLTESIEYVLEELAFLIAYRTLGPEAKPLADHGVSGFNYQYYEPWLVFEKLVNGGYDDKPKEGIGFVIAKIAES